MKGNHRFLEGGGLKSVVCGCWLTGISPAYVPVRAIRHNVSVTPFI